MGVSMNVYGRIPINLQRAKVPLGEIFLIPQRCKGCRLCIEFCPKIVLQESRQTNSKGYHLPEFKAGNEKACVHCEFCTMVCPEFAIFTLEAVQ